MLDFVIFAVTFVVFLLVFVFYLYPGSKSQTTIPGMDPSDPKEGNLSDILQSGSFQTFLNDLHEQYGPIASFYMGTTLIVSLSEPELFEQHQQVFDKPAELFALYKPIIGDRSVLFVNGVDGRRQHKQIEILLNEMCIANIETFYKCSEEMVQKWQTLSSDQHIPVYQYMVALCIKICTKLLFGNYFSNDKQILDFSRSFEICWTELEARAGGSVPEKDSPQDKTLKDAIQRLRNILQKASEDKSNSEQKTVFKALRDLGVSEQQIIDDAITLALKYYSIVSFMTWVIYFLASNKDVQEKLYKEINDFSEKTPTVDTLQKLSYLQKVLDEALRMANVEPWTARVQDIDVEIGGHIIPKSTPVIHALGVALHDEKHWSLSEMFNPDRFDNSDIQKKLSFSPFGFAGKRNCPGTKWTYIQVMVTLSLLCCNFKMRLVEGQAITPYNRIITRPEEEMWIMIEKRK